MARKCDAITESLKILKSMAAQLAAAPENAGEPGRAKENIGEQKSGSRARLLGDQELARKKVKRQSSSD
jgi:hypothetical protein